MAQLDKIIRQKPLFKLKYDEFKPLLQEGQFILDKPLTQRLSNINYFNFRLLESITHNAPQGIVQYESIGEDGGATKNTGRRIESLILTGRLLNKYKTTIINGKAKLDVDENYSDIRRQLFELKDNGIPCELAGHPYMYFKLRKWVITDINTGLNSGQNFLTFTITLNEYRQANVRKQTINLANNENVMQFTQNLAIAKAMQAGPI